MNKLIKPNDVISVDENCQFIVNHKTFTGEEFIEKIKQSTNAIRYEREYWFKEGAECQVLSPKESWKKGRIRICVEFIPDESQTPEKESHETTDVGNQCNQLDEIRKTL